LFCKSVSITITAIGGVWIYGNGSL